MQDPCQVLQTTILYWGITKKPLASTLKPLKKFMQKTLGKEHPTYSLSINRLAELQVHIGNYPMATKLFYTSIRNCEKIIRSKSFCLCNNTSQYGHMYQYIRR